MPPIAHHLLLRFCSPRSFIHLPFDWKVKRGVVTCVQIQRSLSGEVLVVGVDDAGKANESHFTASPIPLLRSGPRPLALRRISATVWASPLGLRPQIEELALPVSSFPPSQGTRNHPISVNPECSLATGIRSIGGCDSGAERLVLPALQTRPGLDVAGWSTSVTAPAARLFPGRVSSPSHEATETPGVLGTLDYAR